MNDLLYGNVSLWPWITVAIAALTAPRAAARLKLSRAKHPSLAGHSRWAKRLARLVPAHDIAGDAFATDDGAPPGIQQSRRAALERVAAELRERFPRSRALAEQMSAALPDAEFTARYRVPPHYASHVRPRLKIAPVVTHSLQGEVRDADGNAFIDLTGSYGVNVFGYDFYKRCIDAAVRRAGALGPVLGAHHPDVAYNVHRLREVSGMDAVSFHMSGTEAVMQAVRLARYHTGRRHLVRFCGAYHGWWEDVQPGVGNPLPPRETYTLRDMDSRALGVLRSRRDIACVLVNPLQALHPNASPPSDSALIGGRVTRPVDRAAYAAWLRQLRAVCSEQGIVLIFDEVFVGFRLAAGGAQQYYGVRADMATYGKTLGGGFPVGVVCGRADLMRRYRAEAPADVCLARGTFNAHPYVMAAMRVFLESLDAAPVQALYATADTVWDGRAQGFNQAMVAAALPLRARHLQSIWTIDHLLPSRYNWLLQYYLRCEGIAVSWVGTGRLIFPLDMDDRAFDRAVTAFVAAGRRMAADGWWWHPAGATDRSVRRQVLTEILVGRFASWLPGRAPAGQEAVAPLPAKPQAGCSP